MRFQLLSFLLLLLLDERGWSLAYDQNQEFIAPTHHRHQHLSHQRQRQSTPVHHKRHQHHHHHQLQQQQQQLPHQALNYDNGQINSFNYSKNYNAPATTTTTTTAKTINTQPTTSSPNASAVRHQTHQHQHHQNSEIISNSHHSHSNSHSHSRSHHHAHHSQAYNGRAPKSIKTDAISAQNFKFTPQNNHIDVTQQDLHIARAAPATSASSLSLSSYATSTTTTIGSDYIDDYIYDDDNDSGAAYGNGLGTFFNTDADLSQTKRVQQHRQQQQQQQQHQTFTDGAYRDHEYARVTRDHSHKRFAYQPQNDKDYAGDEPYRSASDEENNRKPGVLTEQKFRTLGTPDAVYHTRQIYLQEHERRKSPRELALDHVRRMNIATRCKYPLPRVIHVSNDTSKSYNPKAVILHRCGEDTGCCYGGQVCTVKSTQNITLYFFVLNLSNAVTTANLTLTNHTECQCMDPRNLMQQRAKRTPNALNASGTLDEDDIDYESSSSDAEAATNAICRCPKHFDMLSEDVQRPAAAYPTTSTSISPCRCDCLDLNATCQRLKAGAEGFPILDRKCIDEGRCAVPTCSSGVYNSSLGRCPSNHKRLNSNYNDLGNG